MLEINLQTGNGLDKRKYAKKIHMYTFSLVQWATMPWLEEAPLSLSLSNGGAMAQWGR